VLARAGWRFSSSALIAVISRRSHFFDRLDLGRNAGFQVVMNFLVMPIFFSRGRSIRSRGCPRCWRRSRCIDPLTYGIDGVRGVLIGRSHFGVPWTSAVLLGGWDVCRRAERGGFPDRA